MREEEQLICINIDDSGKLVDCERVSVYAGMVFISKKEKDKFITQYRSIVKNIKCKYCKKSIVECDKTTECPELKHNMLKSQHNRQLMNYIKKYSVISCVINNDKVYDRIKKDTASRGRYLDFAIKLLIKETLKGLIKEKKIDANKAIRLVVNIDEQTTKTNGYYNLKDGIIEELKHGIINYNYGKIHKPIVYSELEVIINYQKSEKSYLIQSADLIAGTIRSIYLRNMTNGVELLKRLNFVNYKIFLP